MTFRKPWASPLFPVSRRDFLVTAATPRASSWRCC